MFHSLLCRLLPQWLPSLPLRSAHFWNESVVTSEGCKPHTRWRHDRLLFVITHSRGLDELKQCAADTIQFLFTIDPPQLNVWGGKNININSRRCHRIAFNCWSGSHLVVVAPTPEVVGWNISWEVNEPWKVPFVDCHSSNHALATWQNCKWRHKFKSHKFPWTVPLFQSRVPFLLTIVWCGSN